MNFAAAAHIKPKINSNNKDLNHASLHGTKSTFDIKELTTHQLVFNNDKASILNDSLKDQSIKDKTSTSINFGNSS